MEDVLFVAFFVGPSTCEQVTTMHRRFDLFGVGAWDTLVDEAVASIPNDDTFDELQRKRLQKFNGSCQSLSVGSCQSHLWRPASRRLLVVRPQVQGVHLRTSESVAGRRFDAIGIQSAFEKVSASLEDGELLCAFLDVYLL